MPRRGHASVALEAGTGLYLFDLGEPVGRQLLALRMPVERLKAAFISHMHVDHVGGLFQTIKNLDLYHNHPEYLPQVEALTIALPAEAVDAVKAFFIACHSFPERNPVKVSYIPVRQGPVYHDESISVTALRSTHLDGLASFLAAHPEYSPARQAFSYEIKAEGRRVIYSGDLGEVGDIMATAAGADLLILEFGHLLPLDENLERLAPLGIKKIILTHIFPAFTDKTAELQEIADRVMPGVVTVAEDGLEVIVS